jgi:hypothetical protein
MSLKPITERSADRICCLVIGKYGLGKTSLLRTILGQAYINGEWIQVEETQQEKACVLSAESGLLAVRDLVKAGMVEGYEIVSQLDFKEAYNLLATTQEMKDRYGWIFIDSLTEISARCDEHMRERYPDRAKSFNRWDDYGTTMQLTVKGFRDLKDYSVVFTCLETIDKDQNNRRYPAPDVVGKGLKEKLPSFFDEVLYMALHPDEEGTENRVFYTQPINEYPAKDRSGKLNTIEQPNLLHIKRKILEGGS